MWLTLSFTGSCLPFSLQSKASLAIKRLRGAAALINQAVGDAMSDALFIEAVLTMTQKSIEDWDGLYEDLPSRQDKVSVPDRAAFVPIADETRLQEPASLQATIDKLTTTVKKGRAFARYAPLVRLSLEYCSTVRTSSFVPDLPVQKML